MTRTFFELMPIQEMATEDEIDDDQLEDYLDGIHV
jgi:hypothetical protein